MAGVAILMDKARSDADLLRPSSRLPQPKMAALPICFGRFQPPFAKAPLEASRLKLLLEEVHLGAEGLALFVHGTVSVNLSHKPPVMDGELVELAAEGGVGGPASPKGCEEPSCEGSGWVFVDV